LIDRIHDADERVRASICKVIGSLDFETALHHISEETLKAVGGRMSDKRVSYRRRAQLTFRVMSGAKQRLLLGNFGLLLIP